MSAQREKTFVGKVVEVGNYVTDDGSSFAGRFQKQNQKFMNQGYKKLIDTVASLNPMEYNELPQKVRDDFESFLKQFGQVYIADDIERFVETHGVRSLVVFPLAMDINNYYVYRLLDYTNLFLLTDSSENTTAQQAFHELISWLAEITLLHESIDYSDHDAYTNAHNRLYNRVRKVFDGLLNDTSWKSTMNDAVAVEIFQLEPDQEEAVAKVAEAARDNIARMAIGARIRIRELLTELVPGVVVDIARVHTENISELEHVTYSEVVAGTSEFADVKNQILDLVKENWSITSPDVVQRHESTLEADQNSEGGGRYYVLRSAETPSRLIASMRFQDKGDHVYASMLNVSKVFSSMRITEELMMQTVLLESKQKPVRIVALADNPHSQKYVDVYGGVFTGNFVEIDGKRHNEIQFG